MCQHERCLNINVLCPRRRRVVGTERHGDLLFPAHVHAIRDAVALLQGREQLPFRQQAPQHKQHLLAPQVDDVLLLALLLAPLHVWEEALVLLTKRLPVPVPEIRCEANNIFLVKMLRCNVQLLWFHGKQLVQQPLVKALLDVHVTVCLHACSARLFAGQDAEGVESARVLCSAPRRHFLASAAKKPILLSVLPRAIARLCWLAAVHGPQQRLNGADALLNLRKARPCPSGVNQLELVAQDLVALVVNVETPAAFKQPLQNDPNLLSKLVCSPWINSAVLFILLGGLQALHQLHCRAGHKPKLPLSQLHGELRRWVGHNGHGPCPLGLLDCLFKHQQVLLRHDNLPVEHNVQETEAVYPRAQVAVEVLVSCRLQLRKKERPCHPPAAAVVVTAAVEVVLKQQHWCDDARLALAHVQLHDAALSPAAEHLHGDKVLLWPNLKATVKLKAKPVWVHIHVPLTRAAQLLHSQLLDPRHFLLLLRAGLHRAQLPHVARDTLNALLQHTQRHPLPHLGKHALCVLHSQEGVECANLAHANRLLNARSTHQVLQCPRARQAAAATSGKQGKRLAAEGVLPHRAALRQERIHRAARFALLPVQLCQHAVRELQDAFGRLCKLVCAHAFVAVNRSAQAVPAHLLNIAFALLCILHQTLGIADLLVINLRGGLLLSREVEQALLRFPNESSV